MSKMYYGVRMEFRLHDQDGGGAPLFVRQESGFEDGPEWQTIAQIIESCAQATLQVDITRHPGLRWMAPDDYRPKLSAIVDFNAAFANQVWEAGFENVHLRINLDAISAESYKSDMPLELAHNAIGSNLSADAVRVAKESGLNPETGMPAAWTPKPEQSAEDDALDEELDAALGGTSVAPLPQHRMPLLLEEQIADIESELEADEISVEQALRLLAILIDGTPGAHFKRTSFAALLDELVAS